MLEFTEKTIGDFIDNTCLKFKNNEAIVSPDKDLRYTYTEFKELYDGIAKGLIKLGIKQGEHVAIWSSNSIEWLAIQIATAKIGAVLVCVNSEYQKNELAYALHHSDVTTLFLSSETQDAKYMEMLCNICPELKTTKSGELKSSKLPMLKNVISLNGNPNEHLFKLKDIIEMGKMISDEELFRIGRSVKSTDCVTIQYTSGTTGNPKAVMSTHTTILNNALISGEKFNYTSSDRLITCLPLFHVMGLVLCAFVCFANGATVVLVERFSTKKVLNAIEKERCTVINGVPTMFKFLLTYPDFKKYDVSSLKKGMIAGSYCSPDLMDDILTYLMDDLFVVYGQTEALAITIMPLSKDNFHHYHKSIGKPLPGAEIKIINPFTGKEVPNETEGELCTKTTYIMSGYYKNKKATNKAIDKNGWLHTGDLAIKNKDDHYQLIGRIKEVIIRGGENISPAEIEDVLSNIHYIKDASVVGVPDKNLGETVCAFIILEDGHSVTEDVIKAELKDILARYKIPKYIEFVNTFPCTANGKVQKFKLTDYATKKYELHK